MRAAVVLAVSCCACGGRSGASAAAPEASHDPELLAIVHAWTIENHVITPRSDLGEADARDWHGRKVAITSTGYATPFQGACKSASYSKRRRPLTEVASEVDLAGDSRLIPTRFGLPADVTEFKFVCSDRRDDGKLTLVPILTFYAGTDRAMTCFGGVCYLLTRD
jgi:hypothetical protein